MATKAKSTPGRRRLFMDDDRVQVSLPDEKVQFATVNQYDTQSRKMLVRYEGSKTVDKNWINIKHVVRVDENGKVIPRPVKASDRSASRGRSSSASRKKGSPKKGEAISRRTRSKSRERQPTADFSADEAAEEPIKAKAKSPVKKARKASPARTPKKSSSESTPIAKKSAEKLPAADATPLKDAEFSADEEELPPASAGDELAAAAEANSKDLDASEVSEEPAGCNQNKFCAAVCSGAKSLGGLVCCGVQFVGGCLKQLFDLVVLTLRLTLKNVPMVAIFMVSLYTMLFMVDKKNLRLASFYPDPKLPSIPAERLSWTWLSTDKNVWLANLLSLWGILKYPVFFTLALQCIEKLKNEKMGGYSIILNAGGRRINTKVNLRMTWLAITVATAFVLYAEALLPYFDKLMPVSNPVTPVIKSWFLVLHGHCYDGLCAVFRNTPKFYFYLSVLALFKAYQDFEFDFDISFREWFLNTDDTVSPQTRFLVNFGSELFLQTSFLVLAARNPTNMYLWVIFNSRFILGWLATRGDTEEKSVRRMFQGNNLSGFHFYCNAIFKVFCFTNIWRFISKPERITDDKYRLAAFCFFQLFGFLFSALSSRDYPSDKRQGINAHIRQADRLSDICQLAAMTALSSCAFGNVPCWVLGAYVVCQLVDCAWQEEAQLVKSRSKWEIYRSKVPQKFIPKVY